MALDEELISRSARSGADEESSEDQASSQERVGKFNAGKAAAERAAKGFSGKATSGLAKSLPIGGPAGLAVKAAMLAAKKKQGKTTSEESQGSGNPVTSNLLKSAWQNIIPTWGLSVLWIDIHIFLSQVLGKDLFCSLGSEWFPKGTPRNLDGAKRSLGMVEGMGVGCLNIGCLLLILGFLTVIGMIITGMNNPLLVIKEIFKGLWCALGGCKEN